jgi:hypothetical protein
MAEHLHPALVRLDGQITDLRAARDGADKKAARAAERRYDTVLKWRAELAAFVDLVTQCAELGPPPSDAKCPPRKADARYAPDLDDGVMINSAALWPLLEPQWKDPKKWWMSRVTSEAKRSRISMARSSARMGHRSRVRGRSGGGSRGRARGRP